MKTVRLFLPYFIDFLVTIGYNILLRIKNVL